VCTPFVAISCSVLISLLYEFPFSLFLHCSLEVKELKTLLDVKQRRKRQSAAEGFKLTSSLEDAAEFEYLKNVLYQFMLGEILSPILYIHNPLYSSVCHHLCLFT